MRLTTLLPILTSTIATASTLNVTVLSAQNNASTLECWALKPGFTTSSEAGTAGSKSLAHITLPNSTAEAWVSGGKNGAILALDTTDVSRLGHITKYPSNESTITFEVPLGEEGIPAHNVLYSGACKGAELLE
ncbi:hypothetical protein N7454_000821 [Penicillium verhagenii]|nr:hypothetical protein N7454_000821 [Penicillium verhagenii]